jgi:hypothetical protein
MVGRQAILDGEDKAADLTTEIAAPAIFSVEIAPDPAATVKVE